MALLLPAGACGDSSDGGLDTGVETWTLSSAPLLSIGETDGDPVYLFSGIAAVRLLPRDRVLVADRSSATLRIYAGDGRFERRMGGRGEGPGEFEYLSQAHLDAPDTIEVYDAAAHRLTTFLLDGRVVSTTTFRASDGYPEVYLGDTSDGSHVAAWIRQGPRDPTFVTADVMELGLFEPGGAFSVSLGSDLGMRRLGSPIPFSGHFLGVLVGDTAFHTDGLREVRATGPGGDTVRAFPIPGGKLDPGAARTSLVSGLDSADVERLRALDGTPGLDTVAMVSDLLADPQGLLWLKRYEPATDSHWVLRLRTGGTWLVVTTGGSSVALVSMPEDFRLMDVGRARVAGVARDDLGVERVQIFSLHRE